MKKIIGIAVGVLILQIFFFIPTQNGTTLLPGNWTAQTSNFLLDLLILIIALIVAIAYTGIVKGNRVADLPDGSLGKFFRNYAIISAISLTILSALLSTSVGQISPTTKVPGFVLYGLFVSPSEEILFRVVLPKALARVKIPPLLTASLVFAAFHVWAYWAQSGGSPVQLVSYMVEAAVAGAVFYGLFVKIGLGACMSAHFTFDALVSGVISGLNYGALAV